MFDPSDKAISSSPSPLHSLLNKSVQIHPDEVKAFLWSFTYFFSLLCGYNILKPTRDALGLDGGIKNLPWLFTGTFIAMLAVVPLFGWISSNFPRRQFVPYVYYFFISNLLGFFFLLQLDINQVYVARSFFIWVSVFNLFVVSVFWSFMTDIYSNEQAKRLFPVIAAGGTSGAIIGPFMATKLPPLIGITNLLLVSAGFLSLAALCIIKLGEWREQSKFVNKAARESRTNVSMGGGSFDGIKLVFRSPYLITICVFIILLTTLATFLYFQQAEIIRDAFSSREERISVFAGIDLIVNCLTLLLQLFITGRMLKGMGVAWTLALVPILLMFGFLAVGLYPSLAVIIIVQVIRRAGNYAIMRPAREVLYVVLQKNEKYKAKNFIDTVIYRGGDAVSAWVYAGLQALGLGLAAIAFVAIPMAGIWSVVALYLGKEHKRLALAGVKTENEVD